MNKSKFQFSNPELEKIEFLVNEEFRQEDLRRNQHDWRSYS